MNRRQFHRFALVGASLGAVHGCGGGGGSSTSGASAGTPNAVSPTRYSGVATAGELVDMTLDPFGGLFGYTIVESMFGLAGKIFAGPMRQAFDPLFDGAFFLDGSPDARIFSRPGVAIGVIRELFNAATGQDFRIGIGLHSGAVMSGNVGSQRRMEYAAVGDVTNTAARLQGETKGTPHQLLLSESTRAALRGGDPADLVDAGEFALRGRSAPVRCWSLTPASASPDPPR